MSWVSPKGIMNNESKGIQKLLVKWIIHEIWGRLDVMEIPWRRIVRKGVIEILLDYLTYNLICMKKSRNFSCN